MHRMNGIGKTDIERADVEIHGEDRGLFGQGVATGRAISLRQE